MPNLTLSIPNDTKKRMAAHASVRWSNVVRTIIERKLDDFEEAERLAQKSRLTRKDVDRLSAKVDAAMGRHVKRLLDEGDD